jgi:hypothetical protein
VFIHFGEIGDCSISFPRQNLPLEIREKLNIKLNTVLLSKLVQKASANIKKREPQTSTLEKWLSLSVNE